MKRKTSYTRKAIALSYDAQDEAPKVIATGENIIADKIIEKAKQANVPVHKDEGLAENLSSLELGAYIPLELYEVVAEILIFVDSMDKVKDKVL